MEDIKLDSDANLMDKVAQGDLPAFSELLSRYQSPIFNFIYRTLSDYEEAQDLTQEVFLRVYTTAKRYKPLAKFTTYLFKIARNLCLNNLRKRHRFRLFSLDKEEEIAEIQAPDSNSPEVVYDKKEVSILIEGALASLPENQRMAVVLQRFHHLSYQEMAEVMECSISSVESLLFRARQNLKTRLSASFLDNRCL
ncbi:RNA polymerase sigma factor [bacterium]|nr:RNA polymerase sigma factor [bacterium]MBU0900142.1 RNA polymerase sigma factor [bacterium]MBU1153569.1 RNA polymerase sigma factor [bacterium]MBU1782845.1 RNA polymerase sigma factor [bacterium]